MHNDQAANRSSNGPGNLKSSLVTAVSQAAISLWYHLHRVDLQDASTHIHRCLAEWIQQGG